MSTGQFFSNTSRSQNASAITLRSRLPAQQTDHNGLIPALYIDVPGLMCDLGRFQGRLNVKAIEGHRCINYPLDVSTDFEIVLTTSNMAACMLFGYFC